MTTPNPTTEVMLERVKHYISYCYNTARVFKDTNSGAYEAWTRDGDIFQAIYKTLEQRVFFEPGSDKYVVAGALLRTKGNPEQFGYALACDEGRVTVMNV